MADSAPAPKKRSMLNKPKWAAKTTTAEATSKQGEGEFYRHGNAVYGDVLAEEKRKRAKRRAKAVERARLANEDKPDSKRRRVSEEEDSNSDLEISHSEGRAVTESSSTRREGPVTRSTPTKRHILNRKANLDTASPDQKQTSPVKATVVDLGDNDDDAVDGMPNTPAKTTRVSPLKSRPKPSSSDAESDNEDEYLIELKRRARERARMQKLGITKPQTETPEPTTHKSQSPAIGTDHPQPSSARSPKDTSFHQTPPVPSVAEKVKDTRVSILIQTAIPDTKQLIVNRLASQNLQPVREAWCRRQEFDDPEAMMRKVFLTWRGTRLYDATTCTRILSTMKAERQNSGVMSFDSDDEDSDPSQGKIEVEAITEEIMVERKRAKEQEIAAAAGERGDTEDDSAPEEPEPPKEVDLKIWLKNPDMEPLQLKVHPHTKVSKIMAGFKKIRNVEGGKTCWLIFEGERLEPDTTIDNTEIGDGDLVDVQIR